MDKIVVSWEESITDSEYGEEIASYTNHVCIQFSFLKEFVDIFQTSINRYVELCQERRNAETKSINKYEEAEGLRNRLKITKGRSVADRESQALFKEAARLRNSQPPVPSPRLTINNYIFNKSNFVHFDNEKFIVKMPRIELLDDWFSRTEEIK